MATRIQSFSDISMRFFFGTRQGSRGSSARCVSRRMIVGIVVSLAWTTNVIAQQSLDELNRSIARLAEDVLPGVVQVESNAYAPASTPGSRPGVAMRSSIGSGVILSDDGLIVTNAHVVSGATHVEVQLAIFDGRVGQSILRPEGRRFKAEIVGVDSETDLALLKVDAIGLPALEFADSEQMQQGQLVLAFGNPMGFENSISYRPQSGRYDEGPPRGPRTNEEG